MGWAVADINDKNDCSDYWKEEGGAKGIAEAHS